MEKINLYDRNGNPTDIVIDRKDKSYPLTENEFIPTSIIYIENSKDEFLMQQTSLNKGGKYSSTGGHVDSGETPLLAIIRETKEEIGVDVTKEELKYLGYIVDGKVLRFIYYIKKDVDINVVIVQKEEVSDVLYMSVDKIKELHNKKQMLESHYKVFEKVLEYLEENK